MHLVVSVPPAVPLAQFAGEVKGSSSHLVNHVFAASRPFAWQAEYGVVSFGRRQLERLVQYTVNQRQHHREGTVIAFLERDSEDRTTKQ